MANRWTSAFTETNCSFPYFVVSGLTTDTIISDELAISDVKMMLHRHLIAQGFDAVVFYDPVRMLHFYDAKTSFIVRHTFVPTPQQLQSALARRDAPEVQAVPAHRPVFATRRRPGHQPAQDNRSWGPVWEMNVGQSTATLSYGRLYDLLSNTRFRCAVVFPDCMALQLENAPEIVRARHKALTAPQSNRATNRNIIIFMTESGPHTSINEVLMHRAQATDLANFFSSYIVPKLADDNMQNFLRIPPPNTAEISNMLNMLRLTYGLRVDMGSFSGIARHLATYCNKKWVSMASLFNLIRKWQSDHEGESFGMNAASRITGSSKYETVWQRLDRMVGLAEVKNHFRRLQSMISIESNSDAESPGRLWVNHFVSSMRGHGLNLALLGNSGTGKSTLANLVGELYQDLGLLPTASVTAVSATELTNAAALHERVRLSIGGVLIIDEAYALMNRIDGQDIIDALVADMGTYAGQFAVVLCGYPEQTLHLLEANDGLRRRIPPQNTLTIPDYTWQELKSIFFHIAAQDPSLDVSALQTNETSQVLDNIFRGWHGDAGPGWGNAGEVENLLNAVKARCAERMSTMLRNAEEQADRKLHVTLQDLPENMQDWASSNEENLQTAYQELDGLTGMKNVKRAIFAVARDIQLSNGAIKEPGFYVFHGSPGTGKSMMAEKVGKLFQMLGVVKRRTPYIITARKLLEPPEPTHPGEFVNPQSNRLQQALMLSENGILFIDEAHQLADTFQGTEVLKKLLTVLEDTAVMKNTCIVLAGYPHEMRHLFDVDVGLHSRFDSEDSIIHFEDYTVDELVALLHLFARNASTDEHIGSDHSFDLSDERNAAYVAEARRGLEYVVAQRNPNYGNARYVRTLMHDTLTHQMLRLDALHADGSPITDEEWAVLLPEDLPEKYRSTIREQKQSSNRCIPTDKLTATPTNPIVPENLGSSVASIKQSIFLLQLLDQNRNPIGFGTGFAITEDGYLLTCSHIVKNAAFVRARLYYPGMIGGERWFEDCDILHPIYEDVDMAIIKINGATDFVPLPLRAPDAQLDTTEPIIICGYPFGDQLQSGDNPRFEPSVFYGSISSVQGNDTDAEKVFIDCEAKQDNSGNPVISRVDGRVIGILRGSETKQGANDKLAEEMYYFGPIRLAWERFVAKRR